MAVEVEDLYSNLNTLLGDICKFLTDETNYEKLSPYARKQADELISRSKKQLQDIAKITIDNNDYGAYVDMERKVEGTNENDKNNIYHSVEDANVTPQPVVLPPQPNPYANFPAKDLCQDFKFGTLSWKCRFILKFEKVRRIYAGVHNNWLLVYSSEKDCKPLQTFDLKFHKAQAVTSKPSKSLPQDFELVCTMGERKTYYFLALTHKDMLQWISHINRCNDDLNKSETLSLDDEDISETYDIIPEANNVENENEEEEDIYHDIETYYPEVVNTVIKPPDLPARRCIKSSMPLPSLPQNENDDDSRKSSSSNSSFSQDTEDDDIYEAFVTKPPEPQVNVQNKNKKNSEEIYENDVPNNKKPSIEKPKTPAKPKTFLHKQSVMSKK